MKKDILLLYAACLVCICTFFGHINTKEVIKDFHKRAPYILTFFIEPKKITQQDLSYEELQEKIRKPGKLARSLYKQRLRDPHNKGIYVSYAGLFTYSDQNGQITFPRKTQEDDFYFVITQKIKPVFLHKKTVNHFVVSKKADATMYHVTRKEDKKQKIDYWQISPKKIPANKRIPQNALVIHAKPKHIFVPKEPIVTSNRQNLVLPTIYSTKLITPNINALLFLKTNKYFAPVRFSYKKTPLSYARMTRD